MPNRQLDKEVDKICRFHWKFGDIHESWWTNVISQGRIVDGFRELVHLGLLTEKTCDTAHRPELSWTRLLVWNTASASLQSGALTFLFSTSVNDKFIYFFIIVPQKRSVIEIQGDETLMKVVPLFFISRMEIEMWVKKCPPPPPILQ